MFWENQVLFRYSKISFRRKIILDCMIVALMVFALVSLTFSANAAYTRSHVVDNAKVLSEYEIDNIQAELSTLKKLKLVIVINDVGNRCTDDYAYTYAKSTCQEAFPSDEECMVLAYCSSLEGYKIGIFYQGSFNIDTKRLKNKVVSEYSLYSKDSSWIEGSSIEFINRLNETISSSETPIDEAPSQDDPVPRKFSFWEKYGKYQMIASIIFAIFSAGVITAIVIYRKHRKQIDKDIDYWFKNKEG